MSSMRQTGAGSGASSAITQEVLNEMFKRAELTTVSPVVQSSETPATGHSEQPFAIPGLLVNGELVERVLLTVLRDDDYRGPIVPHPSDPLHLRRPRLINPEIVKALVTWVVGEGRYNARSNEPAVSGDLARWSVDVSKSEDHAAVLNHDRVKRQLGPLYKEGQDCHLWVAAIRSSPVGTVETIIHALSPQPYLGEFEMAPVLRRLRQLVQGGAT